jgi:DNA-binding MarR family transcriptional regulator/GNAT superfamily N-acetyltransferase
MVAVRMVSEGVDVPRLAVGVYATSTSTPLFFSQAVGRFVRARARGETASVFLPSVSTLLGYAAEMEVERDHVLGRAITDEDDIFAAEQDLLARANSDAGASDELLGSYEALGSQARFDQVVYDGAAFGHADEVHVGSEEEMDFLGIPGLLEPDQVRELLHHRQRARRTSAAAAQEATPEREPSTHEQLAVLRRTVSPTRRCARSSVARRPRSRTPSSSTPGSTASGSGPPSLPVDPFSDYSQRMGETDVLRRFNRAWSQRVGLLEESYLGQGRSLGASRLLFEMGVDGAGVLELRRRLGLDSGYLSRLLRTLEDDGLVAVRRDPADQRRRLVVPTARGRRAIERLEDRSEGRARALVEPLGESQRRRLTEALATAEQLIRAATCVFEPVDVAADEAMTAMTRYFTELDERFDGGFDPVVAASTDLEAMSPPGGAFRVARVDGSVVACGGVQPHAEGIGEIKRMWVDPAWRGCGLGVRMLAALEDAARDLGCREVYLDTNGNLTEAIAMYDGAGYRRIERYNDNPYAQAWFGKRLR